MAGTDFHRRLRALSPALLKALRRGIEKESLRVRPDGALALTPHPEALGSALKHPYITTDFSESLIELITGVHLAPEDCLEQMKRIHQFVYRKIGEELLWGASMPCYLPGEQAIPIARYGSSNVGRAKTVYRTGLAHRYGKRMQMIAGIHYNFSLPESAWPLPGLASPNEGYFALIRNFRRHGWLLYVLFGASPAVCSSFVAGREHALRELVSGTLYLPHATSLRMGRLGYLSEAQDSLAVSCNSLESYSDSLQIALTRPYPPYEAIGLKEGGEYQQLATSLLQIENEYYAPIRPKRIIRSGERPLHALRERGVQYVEVRAMDLDPFAPLGIVESTMRFLDVFLLHCLLSDSPPDSEREILAMRSNNQLAASRGRETGLLLERGARKKAALRDWGAEILGECAPIAAALDAAHGGSAHAGALSAAVAGLAEPDALPSARVLEAMRREHGGAYSRFALAQSKQHREALLAEPLPAEFERAFERLALESIAKQKATEAADRVSFDAYLERYLSRELLQA